jgi:hypothetical protein
MHTIRKEPGRSACQRVLRSFPAVPATRVPLVLSQVLKPPPPPRQPQSLHNHVKVLAHAHLDWTRLDSPHPIRHYVQYAHVPLLQYVIESADCFTDAQAGPSKPGPTSNAGAGAGAGSAQPKPSAVPVNPSKLAANKRLPATMVLPGGVVQPSTKNKKGKQLSKKQKARVDKGRDKAVERSGVLAEKERQREERKVSKVCVERGA